MASLLLISVLLIIPLASGATQLNQSFHINLGSTLAPQTRASWASPSGLFAFGFYAQNDGFAVGIWLASKPNITVVWTAYRDDPPVTANSTVELTRDGRLLLRTTYDEKPITGRLVSATSASMLDSGNFVLYNRSRVVWASFDYPTDTILGGQNLTVRNRLVSSLSTSEHSSGRFCLVMQIDGNLVAYPRNSSSVSEDAYWSTATVEADAYRVLLNLDRSGSLRLLNLSHDGLSIKNLSSSSWPAKNEAVIFRAILNSDGNFVLYSHGFTTFASLTRITTEWTALKDPCQAKGVCGVNSYCLNTAGKAECHCFPGYSYLNKTIKLLGCYRNFSDEESCNERGLTLSYSITDLENMDLGVFPYSVTNLSKKACRQSCLEDCNCWACLYADGSCKKLKVPMIYGVLNKSKSTMVFVKSSFPNNRLKAPIRPVPAIMNTEIVVIEKKRIVFILAITFGFLALVCTLMASSSFFFYRSRAHRYSKMSANADLGLNGDTLRSFSFDELEKLTGGFKEVIGRNSFGEVYKGVLADGKRAVAVKRLERVFQGERGFQAEMTSIGQTHHRNLVRLLGFCIQGARKLLVYEFMSNGSLADLLFKAERRPSWTERVRMALDVARGILYLHEECEARIIHCNIKPHNILFDESWTAKISDFGLSKLLRPNQSGILTGIRGTRGYLAPEWQKNALITTKVDIYSFGVVLLEILCCRSNMEVDVSTADEILLPTWVYSCLVSKELNRLVGDEEVDLNTLERMVKVGLLCTQEDPDVRPSIKNVILMLEGTSDIPDPPSPTHLLV